MKERCLGKTSKYTSILKTQHWKVPQHPTDLILEDPYYSLVVMLCELDVLPDDIMLISSRFWGGYSI